MPRRQSFRKPLPNYKPPQWTGLKPLNGGSDPLKSKRRITPILNIKGRDGGVFIAVAILIRLTHDYELPDRCLFIEATSDPRWLVY